jgi:hypothetical protein
MPVRVTLAAKDKSDQSGRFIASAPRTATVGSDGMMYSGCPRGPALGRISCYEDDVWSRNEWDVPLTNFAGPWSPNLLLASDFHEQNTLSHDRPSQTHSAKIPGMYQSLLHHGPGAGKGRSGGSGAGGPGRVGVHGVPGVQGKQDERSHASSEDTLLYLEDLQNDDPSAEYEASESTEAGDAELEKIYKEYLADGEGNGRGRDGVTIMLRDIPYRMQVEPHVFDLLKNTCDMRDVDYIYLPMTITNGSDAVRNKGYCFIHFSNNASAELFVSRLEHYVVRGSMFPSAKMMITGAAKFQGLSLNLHNLLDIHSKKWRPKNGYAYIRCAGGDLVPCKLLHLRNLLKRRAAAQHENKRGFTGMKRRTDGKAFRDPLLLAPRL